MIFRKYTSWHFRNVSLLERPAGISRLRLQYLVKILNLEFVLNRPEYALQKSLFIVSLSNCTFPEQLFAGGENCSFSESSTIWMIVFLLVVEEGLIEG